MVLDPEVKLKRILAIEQCDRQGLPRYKAAEMLGLHKTQLTQFMNRHAPWMIDKKRSRAVSRAVWGRR